MSELPPRAEVIDAMRYAVAPAAAAALLVFGMGGLLLWRLTPQWRRAMPAVSVLSLTTALLAGNYFRGSLPWQPDAAWWHWAGPVILLALTAELLARLWRVPAEAGMLFRGLAAGIGAAAVTPPDWQVESRWVFPLLAAVVAAEWGVLVAVGRRHGGGTVALAMAVVAAGAGAVLLHHNVLRFSDVATFVQVALGMLAVAAWLTRTDATAAAAVSVLPLTGVLLLGRYLSESEVRWGCFVAVGLAPLTLAVLAALPRRWWAAVVAVVLVGSPVAWAVGTAMRDAPLKFEMAEKWDG